MNTEEAFLDLVQLGFFSVDVSGRIWRRKCWTRSGNVQEIAARRAERVASGGYLQVVFVHCGVRHHCTAGRLVWLTLHGKIPDGMEINHKNGDKSDNSPRNLELVTPSGNTRHAYAIGLKQPAARPLNGLVKLNADEAEEIRELYKSVRCTQQSLAGRFGVTQSTISKILRGQIWPPNGLRSTE